MKMVSGVRSASTFQNAAGFPRRGLARRDWVPLARWGTAILGLLVCLDTGLQAQPPPPPPPQPSSTSQVGDTVTNPVTGLTTTVSELLVDPAGTPTAGATAFVRTADGYAFLVKAVGQTIYNSDDPPLAFVIVSSDPATNTVQLDADPPGGPTASLSTKTRPRASRTGDSPSATIPPSALTSSWEEARGIPRPTWNSRP